MTWPRRFTKKRFFILVAVVAIIYVQLWFLTYRFGVPQVREVALGEMHKPAGYTEVSRPTGQTAGGIYWCNTRAYGPLLVRAEYGWRGGPLYGDGGRTLYLWLFGHSYRIRELEHWAE